MNETLWYWWVVVGEFFDGSGEYASFSREVWAEDAEDARKQAISRIVVEDEADYEIFHVYGPYQKP